MSDGFNFLRARSDQMGKECTWNAVGPGFKPHMWGCGVIFLVVALPMCFPSRNSNLRVVAEE